MNQYPVAYAATNTVDVNRNNLDTVLVAPTLF